MTYLCVKKIDVGITEQFKNNSVSEAILQNRHKMTLLANWVSNTNNYFSKGNPQLYHQKNTVFSTFETKLKTHLFHIHLC